MFNEPRNLVTTRIWFVNAILLRYLKYIGEFTDILKPQQPVDLHLTTTTYLGFSAPPEFTKARCPPVICNDLTTSSFVMVRTPRDVVRAAVLNMSPSTKLCICSRTGW